MGMDVPALRFVLDTRQRTGGFGRLLQIGHQGIHIWPDLTAYADDLVRESGLALSLSALIGSDSFADTMFRNLGASQVDVMDASPYEGANIIHDLNEPIQKRLRGQFKTIYDGGTLEHIFNTPIAVTNLMSMLKIGGTLMIATTANNYLGHGFYQFSPEWAFRTFSRRWGFEILSCYLVDCDRRYELVPAVDPEAAGKRVEMFMTPVPTYLMIAAKKIEEKPLIGAPQQSDYVAQWQSSSKAQTQRGVLNLFKLKRS
jgi:hypothetical protein